MNLYAITRKSGWGTIEDVEAASERSATAREEMGGRVEWVTSYVTQEPEGRFGTVCIYRAADEALIHEHGERADLPVDKVQQILGVKSPED